MKRTNKTKKEILEKMQKIPVIEVVCQQIGITRMTLSRWRKEDKEFSEQIDKAISDGNSLVSDLAISQLISSIKENNLGAIKFWLENHHVDYAAKLHITAKIEQEIIFTPEQEAVIRRGLELVSKNNINNTNTQNHAN